jgi:DoxX-like family
MTHTIQQQLLTCIIASVWFINGLFCKVLNGVPRHQLIVANILGDQYARLFTLLIGFSEMIMAAWILSRKWKKLNAISQMLIVAIMNTLEFLLVPDLLLWGKANAVFALIFIGMIWYNQFQLDKNVSSHS